MLFCEVDILRTPSSPLSGLNKGKTWDEDEDAGAPPGPSFRPHSSSGLPTRQAEAGGYGPLLGPFRRNEFRPVMDTSDGKDRIQRSTRAILAQALAPWPLRKQISDLLSPLCLSCPHLVRIPGRFQFLSFPRRAIVQGFLGTVLSFTPDLRVERKGIEKLRNLSLPSIANAASPVSGFLSYVGRYCTQQPAWRKTLSSLLPGDHL